MVKTALKENFRLKISNKQDRLIELHFLEDNQSKIRENTMRLQSVKYIEYLLS